MSSDLEQFHEVFFEESLEAIDTMESALLKLDVGAAQPDLINTIFRVAHSIKGGSGMFGFNDITSFTHTLETLLDELRSDRMAVTQPICDLLLKSVDVMREMLGAVQGKQPVDVQRVSDLQFDLELIVVRAAKAKAGGAPAAPVIDAGVVMDDAAGSAGAGAADAAPAVDAGSTAHRTYDIEFRPNAQLLVRGNDPLRLFAELAELGTVDVTVHTDAVPAFASLDPEICYLRWDLSLTSEITRPVVEEVFDWTEGDCDLKITERGTAPRPETDGAASAEPEMPAVANAGSGAENRVVPLKPAAPAQAAAAAGADASSIRVSTEKIDELLNIVGEVVITQSMLEQIGESLEGAAAERLRSGLSQLERHVRELQESVMRVRMLPISFVFSRFPRLVRDLSGQLGKHVTLKMTGEHTELDKTVLEKIGDPLVHLVRNSLDHGIENSAVRSAAGKPESGTIHLNAYHRGGAIIVEVSDDGAGLNRTKILAKARERGLVGAADVLSDESIHELMFMPGFSTAEKTTDISGRGVGMDVVRRNISELGGTIEVRSVEGEGSRFTISLPLTLAIVDGQSVMVGDETYIVPLVSIVESLQLTHGMASRMMERGEVFSFRGEYVPVVRLHQMFNVKARSAELHEGLIMVVEGDGRKVGIFVDELLGQQQVVIKSLETNYGRVDGVSGATILGEGTVALILDIPGLIRKALERVAA